MRARAASTSEPDLIGVLQRARAFLLRAAARCDEEQWTSQPSPAYSPVGWHVGHVAAVQERWLLPGAAPRYGSFFDPFRTEKAARTAQPSPAELRGYLDDVLGRVCDGLRKGRLPGILGLPETFLVWHVAQHELQHAEHVQVVTALCEGTLHRRPPRIGVRDPGRLEHAGGRVQVGCSDANLAYDNERPVHEVTLRPFWVSRTPVTAGEYARFIKAGGYDDTRFWSSDGWEWRTRNAVTEPLHFREQHRDAPVTCLSWYEADAYARFAGARLPAEHELEAAGLGPAGVWEWTSSWFAPYPRFRAYPYEGYSVPWFHTHRVLRGGSWATSPELVRPSLRNWYEPHFREFPGGLRCAGDL